MSEFMKSDPLLKNRDNTRIPQKGRIVDNNDPLKLGRVKVEIQSLSEGLGAANVDWVYLETAGKPGRAPGTFDFPEIPEIGCEVEVSYPYDSNENPRVSTAVANNINTDPSLFGEDYPSTFGSIDSTQLKMVNKEKNEITHFMDKLCNLFHIAEDGTLVVNLPKDLVVNIDGNLYLDLKQDIGIAIDGNLGTQISGSREVKLGGNDGIVAGGFITHKGSSVTHNSGVRVGIVDGIIASVSEGSSRVKTVVSKFKKMFGMAKTADMANRDRIGKE